MGLFFSLSLSSMYVVGNMSLFVCSSICKNETYTTHSLTHYLYLYLTFPFFYTPHLALIFAITNLKTYQV